MQNRVVERMDGWRRLKARFPKNWKIKIRAWNENLIRRVPILSSLRAKLIIPYVLLTLIIALIGVFIITQLVAGSFQERFGNQMIESSRVTADSIVRREREHLENLRLLAFMQGVPEAIMDGDEASLRQIFESLAINNKIEILGAIDRRGGGIVTLVYQQDGDTPQTSYYLGEDYSDFEPLRQILDGKTDTLGDKYAGLLSSSVGDLLITTAPVFTSEEEFAGVLFVGSRLDTLLSEIKLLALADIIMIDTQGEIISTTFTEPEGGFGELLLPPDLVESMAFNTLNRDVELYGRQYSVLYAPLEIRDASAGVLGVALPNDFIVGNLSTSRNSFSVIFTLGTLAVILLGYILAQHIARPILRLRAMSQAVAGGDLEQSSGLMRSDEIGELANAFDIMTLRLRERTEEATRLYAEALQRARELADINARLQAAQAQLVQSEKLASVGQLTAGIVHDVKNPLAVIKGLAEELTEEPDLDEYMTDSLKTIRDSASKANSIVTDLLKFARQSTPDMQQRDLRSTIESVRRLTEYLTRKANVEVASIFPDRSVMATYDPQQIEQVLINLLTNAVQAMPEGGSLTFELRPGEHEVELIVSDTGIGIPDEIRARIFDPFFTTKPEGEGTGLGLSVSYGIITRHGGHIEVVSKIGIGTTFTIHLPTHSEEFVESPDDEEFFPEAEEDVTSPGR
ncbi:MAG: HAMP domain-containing protein [Anaerolineales bacterium]|nr:MAG: HAMP domain-containing protein [Anaerolineales bacterium]